MAVLAAKACLASLALSSAAAAPLQLDGSALFQKEVRSHAAEGQLPFAIPGMGGGAGGASAPGMPSMPGFPGLPGMGGGNSSMPQPSMEDMLKIMSQVVEYLRNQTVVDAILASIDEQTQIAVDSKREIDERYAAFNESIRVASPEDLIPLTVNFMEAEMDALKPQIHKFTKSFLTLIKKLPLGKDGRNVKVMVAMAEPMMIQGMDQMMRPLKDNIEIMGNTSTFAFCQGAEPIVLNATTALEPLKQFKGEIKKAVEQLPSLQTSPMAFMMPDVIPQLVKIGTKMAVQTEAMMNCSEAQALNLNTTFRYVLNERLDCDVVIQSGAARRGLGVLALLASVAAWLSL